MYYIEAELVVLPKLDTFPKGLYNFQIKLLNENWHNGTNAQSITITGLELFQACSKCAKNSIGATEKILFKLFTERASKDFWYKQ